MKVSILIPMYNAEKFIAETIESALNQTWHDKEIIIVDDGSSDKSFEIALRYESDIVKVFRKPNSGASATRNFAFSKSTGEFIQYLDADDLMDNNKIKYQIEILQKHSNTVAYCETVVFEETIHNVLPVETIKGKNYNQPENLLMDFFDLDKAILSHSYLIIREIVEKVGGWNENLSRNDDGEFFARIISASEKVIFVDRTKVYYRNTPQSLSKQISLNYLKSEMLSLILISQLMINKYDSTMVREICGKRLNLFINSFYPANLSILKDLELFMNKYQLSFDISNKSLVHLLFIKLFGWRFVLNVKYYYKFRLRKLILC